MSPACPGEGFLFYNPELRFHTSGRNGPGQRRTTGCVCPCTKSGSRRLENSMRKVLVTLVLALTGAVSMASANAQQPADSQANTPTNQKVIKDQAEYNAYMTALNTQDPVQK